MAKRERADLHERFASWLENKAGERIAEFEEIAGYHLAEAHRYRAELGPIDETARSVAERAAGYLSSAGRRALARWDVAAAANLLSRSVELLPPHDERRVSILPDLGLALAQFDLHAADEVLAEAVASAHRIGALGIEGRAAVRRIFVRLHIDPEEDQRASLETAERYASLFEARRDDRGVAEARNAVGTILFWQGQMKLAAESLQLAVDHARRAGDRRQEADSLRWLALVILEGPTPVDEGLRRLADVLDRHRGDRRVRIDVDRVRAQLEAMRGRSGEARRLIARVEHLVGELNDPVTLGAVLRHAGQVEMLAGDAEAAEAELRSAYDIYDRLRDTGHLASVAPDLGDALYRQGRFDEASHLAEVGERSVTPGDLDAEVRWRQLRAKLWARTGRAEEGVALAADAVRLVAGTECDDLHALALVALGETLRLAGHGAQAETSLHDALSLYRRKGNVAAATRLMASIERSGS